MRWNQKMRFVAAGALATLMAMAASLVVAQTSWTTPRTFADDDILTAAELNTDVRDNSTHLKETVDGLTTSVGDIETDITGIEQDIVDLEAAPGDLTGIDAGECIDVNDGDTPTPAVRVEADCIDEALLDATNAPTDGQFLTYDSGSGGFTWQPIGFDMSRLGVSISTKLKFYGTAVLTTTAKPKISYSFRCSVKRGLGTAHCRIYYWNTTGGSTLIASTVTASCDIENDEESCSETQTITGTTGDLVSGPKAVIIALGRTNDTSGTQTHVYSTVTSASSSFINAVS